MDPHERKIRNRTVAALGFLALVNAYVFLGTDAGLESVASMEAAAIGAHRGPLPPLGEAPDQACGPDPIRVFDGLERLIHLEATLRGGYTLRLALLQLGVPGEEIDRVEASIRSKVDLGLLGGSGAPLRVALDRQGGIHALEIELSEGHLLQACRAGVGEYEVRNLQHPLRTDVEVIALELGRDADLGSAIERAGEQPELARILARALAHEVDFLTETRPGDRLQVMVEKRYLGRRFHRYGTLLAARFRGSLRRASLVRWKPEGGETAYFDTEGLPTRRSVLRSPVGWFPVDSEARALLVPTVEVVEGVLGAAYRLPEGAPVVALGDATVRAAGRTLEEGNYLDLELQDGTVVRYCHLLRVVGELTAGVRVEQGQVVGLAGHTGRTPYDRLRMELWRQQEGEAVSVDPLTATAEDVPRMGEAVAEDQRARFLEDTAPQRKSLRLR